MRWHWLALILCLVTVPALAEDLYVAQSAAGADNGTSCANAKSAAWFNTAANWGGGAGEIDPGDTAHLCGTITTALVAKMSGTAGNVITILWETGAKISLPVCPFGVGCLNIASKAYLVIDGGSNGIIESNDNGTLLGSRSTSTLLFGEICSNCEVKNLTARNSYVHTADLTDVTLASASGAVGIELSGDNVLIHDNIVSDNGYSIYYLPRSVNYTNVQIYNNTCTNSDHCVTIGGYGTGTFSAFKIYNNTFSNYSNWDTTIGQYHHDGVHLFSSLGAAFNDFDIYNNTMTGDCGTQMTGHIFSSGGDGSGPAWERLRVFNNVLSCSTLVNGLLWLSVRGNAFQVYNNTILAGSTSTCVKLTSLTNVVFKNNVMTGCNYFVYLDPSSTFANAATDFNYNAYADIASSHKWHWLGTCSNCTSFATWKSSCGCDANAAQVASAGLDAGGVPQAGAAVIDMGVNLSSLAITALNTDRLGNARYVGAGWDTGAFEYGASAPGSGPIGVRALSLPGSFSPLVWAPSTDASTTGYRVYHSTTPGVGRTLYATITAASAAAARSPMTQLFIPPSVATTYYFTVTSFSATTESAVSAEVSIAPVGALVRTQRP